MARRASSSRGEVAQVVLLLVIVLAVIAGGLWFLKRNRDMREREAQAFANEIASKLVYQNDVRFLDRNLTQKAQLMYPPSWRLRIMDYIKTQGPPPPQFKWTKSEVLFNNYFFDPAGSFIAQFDYPPGPAYLEMQISHPGALWVIDAINWTWTPAPTPAPTPFVPAPEVVPLPSPSPSPSPAAKSKAKRS